MIEKFLSIKNIGRFRDCKAVGEISFRKLTLIYAENGRGKTTLCAILRSLQSGKPEPISERKTLGTADPASVQIRINGTTVSYSNNSWSLQHPDIAIFDSTFVHENVHAGDYIDHEHKKNLYRVIVGEEGVALARRVDELDAKIRDVNKQKGENKDDVERYVPEGVDLEDFVNLKPQEDLDGKIHRKNKEIESLERVGEIIKKSALSKIPKTEFPANFQTLLAKSLADLSFEAEACVKSHIAKCMDQKGEPWLAQGLGYVRDDRCPFCGDDLKTNILFAAYRSFFSAGYATLKTEIAHLEQRIKTAFQEEAMLNLQKAVAENQSLADFWKQFVQVDLPSLSFDDARTILSEIGTRSLELVRQKLASPLGPIQPGADFLAALSRFNSLNEAVENYSSAVEGCNTRIAGHKELASKGDINVAKGELLLLTATKRRFEPSINAACLEYAKSIEEKSKLDAEKDKAKSLLDQYCSGVLVKNQESINDYLDLFNTGFRITNTKRQYVGGTPRSDFQIVINEKPIDLGDAKTPPGRPCFRTALSSGDRSALALAFFLASLKQDARIAQKIVVLDDPLSSLDRFRRACTQQLILEQSGAAHQVIVLSHDPHFLKLVWDGYPAGDVKTLQLTHNGDNTTLNEWDVEAETLSDYLKNYNTLLAFYRAGSGNIVDVARSIRPFLEGMLRMHFPGHFAQYEWLGDFIAKIRQADESSPLSHAKADLRTFEAINDYSKKFHHDQNPGADSVPISETELRGYVKQTLNLVGGC